MGVYEWTEHEAFGLRLKILGERGVGVGVGVGADVGGYS